MRVTGDEDPVVGSGQVHITGTRRTRCSDSLGLLYSTGVRRV